MHYFDLLIRLETEQEYLFRSIHKTEYKNLFDFIKSKGLKIMKLRGVQATDGVVADLQDERKANNGDDEGSPTDDSGDDSDASEDVGEKKRISKKEPSASKTCLNRKSKKGNNDDGSRKRKEKKKKDPNSPKRSMSGFMFFSQLERENVKKNNPGIPCKDLGRVIGDQWNKLSGD